MTFEPWPCPYARWGILASIASLLAAIAIMVAIARLPFSGLSFVLALLATALLAVCLYLLYRSLCCLTLAYWVDRDGVTVVWLFARQIIPMMHIQRILRGTQAQTIGPWWAWPARYMARLAGGPRGSIVSLATRPPSQQVLLVTPAGIFGLSPKDPDGFLEALQERYQLGPARPLTPGRQLPRVARWPIWRDRLGMGLLALGFLGALALFGWLSFTYPQLPERLPLHFNLEGVPDRIGPRAGLLALPIIGLLTWIVNGVAGGLAYARQRLGAYLLWGGTLVVQVLAGIALANLLP